MKFGKCFYKTTESVLFCTWKFHVMLGINKSLNEVSPTAKNHDYFQQPKKANVFGLTDNGIYIDLFELLIITTNSLPKLIGEKSSNLALWNVLFWRKSTKTFKQCRLFDFFLFSSKVFRSKQNQLKWWAWTASTNFTDRTSMDEFYIAMMGYCLRTMNNISEKLNIMKKERQIVYEFQYS